MADDWYKRAQLALQKGDEELAREALKRRKTAQDNAGSMRAQLEQQTAAVEKLLGNTRLLESKVRPCAAPPRQPRERGGAGNGGAGEGA